MFSLFSFVRLYLIIIVLIHFGAVAIAQDFPQENYYTRYIYGDTVFMDTIQDFKQYAYCDRDIEWAGMVDIDIIPNQKKNQSWDNFKKSGFSNLNFKQYTADSMPIDSSLMDYLIRGIENRAVPIYETPELNKIKLLGEGDLYHTLLEEAEEKHYKAADFEVLRLRCFLVYMKYGGGYYLHPVAAAPIRTVYDIYTPSVQASYRRLGWIPIKRGQVEQATWQKTIHSDVNFDKVYAFKQGWTPEQCIQDWIATYKEDASKQQMYDGSQLDQSTILSREEVEDIINYEHITYDPETFEELTVRSPYESFGLVGLNVSIQWAWDETKKQLYLEPIKFSPIAHKMDILCNNCEGENMFLYRLFSSGK